MAPRIEMGLNSALYIDQNKLTGSFPVCLVQRVVLRPVWRKKKPVVGYPAAVKMRIIWCYSRKVLFAFNRGGKSLCCKWISWRDSQFSVDIWPSANHRQWHSIQRTRGQSTNSVLGSVWLPRLCRASQTQRKKPEEKKPEPPVMAAASRPLCLLCYSNRVR